MVWIDLKMRRIFPKGYAPHFIDELNSKVNYPANIPDNCTFTFS